LGKPRIAKRRGVGRARPAHQIHPQRNPIFYHLPGKTIEKPLSREYTKEEKEFFAECVKQEKWAE